MLQEFESIWDGHLGRTNTVKTSNRTGIPAQTASSFSTVPRRSKGQRVLEGGDWKDAQHGFYRARNVRMGKSVDICPKEGWVVRILRGLPKNDAVIIRESYPIPRMD